MSPAPAARDRNGINGRIGVMPRPGAAPEVDIDASFR